MGNPLNVVCPQCSAVNRIPAQRLDERPNCGRCHRPLFTGHPSELSADALQKHIARNDVPVLVDFWAPWCGPCRMMAPAYEQVAGKLEPHVRLAKLNTEQAPAISAQFAIRSIPTLALFRGGREVARQSGAIGADGILSWTRSHL
ncbi:MAG: thioredoxin TrxC [Gammaproteobacteria bacterium]|nr:thioredoxin TrxC [Gammaproteobacteria bacterium]